MNNTTAKSSGTPGFNMTPEHKKLNLGCGFNKKNDHWNVDKFAGCNPDEVLDLEVFPWPWEDNFFTKIHASNILEHLGQNPNTFTQVMKELYRVSAPGAIWEIQVPHHRCDLYYDDYTHVRALTEKTFKMFDQNVNIKSIERGLSDSTFGLYHNIDIEVYKSNYNLVSYWTDLEKDGMLGSKELNIKLNTMSNVVESIDIFIKVHKPCRQENWLKTNTK